MFALQSRGLIASEVFSEVGRKFAPIEDRMQVYRLVRSAVESQKATSATRLLRELQSTGYQLPSRNTILRWIASKTSPLSGKRLFSPEASENLSFFIGAWLGDGWGDTNDGGKRMLLKVRSFDFAREFARSAEKILGKTDSYWVRRIIDPSGSWFQVKVTSFMLYDFMNQPLSNLRKFIEPCPRGFLRGIFTAEGFPSVNIFAKNGPGLAVGLGISNSDYSLLDFSKSLLTALGFNPGGIRLVQPAGTITNLARAVKPGWLMTL